MKLAWDKYLYKQRINFSFLVLSELRGFFINNTFDSTHPFYKAKKFYIERTLVFFLLSHQVWRFFT